MRQTQPEPDFRRLLPSLRARARRARFIIPKGGRPRHVIRDTITRTVVDAPMPLSLLLVLHSPGWLCGVGSLAGPEPQRADAVSGVGEMVVGECKVFDRVRCSVGARSC
jgi:hypothetical protein